MDLCRSAHLYEVLCKIVTTRYGAFFYDKGYSTSFCLNRFLNEWMGPLTPKSSDFFFILSQPPTRATIEVLRCISVCLKCSMMDGSPSPKIVGKTPVFLHDSRRAPRPYISIYKWHFLSGWKFWFFSKKNRFVGRGLKLPKGGTSEKNAVHLYYRSMHAIFAVCTYTIMGFARSVPLLVLTRNGFRQKKQRLLKWVRRPPQKKPCIFTVAWPMCRVSSKIISPCPGNKR